MQITSHTTYRKLVHYISVTFLVLFLCAFQQDKDKQTIPKSDVLPSIVKAEVIGIQDGDTIELKFLFDGKKAGHRQGKPLRIRLLHVNCPERGKPYYKVAKQYTSDLVFRKKVQIRHAGNFDRYGRLLGEVVMPDGKFLNKELVKMGYAVHFKKYSNSKEYAQLETEAQKKKIGIWSMDPITLGKL